MHTSPRRRPKAEKPNKNVASVGWLAFLEAWGIVVFLVFLLVLGVTIPAYLISNKPAAPETETASGAQKTPPDVPLMPGAVLTRHTSSGRTSIFNYTIAQGSLASVQAYYRKQLEQRDWVRQPRSNSVESEYLAEDKKLVITLSYQGSHVQVRLVYTATP